jgi:hypothetical protein
LARKVAATSVPFGRSLRKRWSKSLQWFSLPTIRPRFFSDANDSNHLGRRSFAMNERIIDSSCAFIRFASRSLELQL